MPTPDNHDVTLALSQDQLEFMGMPRNEEDENHRIAEAKLQLLLLSMLSYGGLSELIPGEKKGKFWVTPKFRIAMEPHVAPFDSDPQLGRMLRSQRDAIKNQVSLLVEEARLQSRQGTKTPQSVEPTVIDNGSREDHQAAVLDGMRGHCEAVYGGGAPANPRPFREAETSAGQTPANPVTDLSQFRFRMAGIDAALSLWRSGSIFHPFGRVLDNTGDLDCRSCSTFLSLLSSGNPCPCSSCPCYWNYLRYRNVFELKPKTLIDVYAEHSGMLRADAVKELQEKLGISADKPLNNLDMSERSKVACAVTAELQSLGLLDNPHSAVFRSADGQHALGSVLICKEDGGKKCSAPFTTASYSTGGWSEWLRIPFGKPYPLLNLDALRAHPDVSVVLTDSLEAAGFGDQHVGGGSTSMFPPTEVRASWYGGRTAVPHVDWRPLAGRKVRYWVIPHSGLSMKQHLETAVNVCFRLRALPGTEVRVALASELAAPCHGVEMTEEVFLEHASDAGLAGVVNQLRAKSRKAVRRPVRRGDKVQLALGRPLLFPAVLRLEEVVVLYAGKEAGKSALAMRLAFCAATGTQLFRPWGVEGLKKTKVLYLDGEMTNGELERRAAANRRVLARVGVENDLFAYHCERLDLYSEDGRAAVLDLLRSLSEEQPRNVPVELLVIDNLTAMTPGGDFHQGWDAFFTWARELTESGMTVLVIHHAKEDEGIKGTQSKILNADRVLYLKKVAPNQNTDAGSSDDGGNSDEELDILRTRLVTEHARGVQFSEIRKPLEMEFDKRDASWVFTDQRKYTESVLKRQASSGLTDAEMGEFWGLTKRQTRTLRDNHNVEKNQSRKG